MIMLVRPMKLRLAEESGKGPQIFLGHRSKKIVDG